MVLQIEEGVNFIFGSLNILAYEINDTPRPSFPV